MRWAGAGVASAGAIAIAIGGGLALQAKNQYDSVAAQCPEVGCTRAAFDTRNDARSKADVATVVIVTGALAVAGGAVLWLLAPSDTTRVGLGPGGAAVRIGW